MNVPLLDLKAQYATLRDEMMPAPLVPPRRGTSSRNSYEAFHDVDWRKEIPQRARTFFRP